MRFINHPKDDTPRSQAREAVKRMLLVRGCRVGDRLPSYRQLAEELGISLLTVERVMADLAAEGIIYRLHGKGSFLQRLPDDDHRPQIGLVYPASRTTLLNAPYLHEMMVGLVHNCDHRHADLQILSCRAAGGRIPPRDVSGRVDGVIMVGVLNEDYIAEFAAENIPLVLVDTQTNRAAVPCICVDNALAVRQVVEHLHGLGHRRITFVDTPSPDALVDPPAHRRDVDSADNRERRDAYSAEMARLGLADHCRILATDAIDPDALAARVVQCLRQESDPPTALLTYDAKLARQTIEALRQADLRVPHDVSVAAAVGAKDDRLAGDLLLTYSHALFWNMGRRAAEMLCDRIRHSQAAPIIERIGCELIPGATTAPAPP